MIQWISKIIRLIGTILTREFPLWLFIVVCVVCVMLASLISCNANKNHHVKALSVGTAMYNGHTWLLFENPNYLDGTFVVVHDPDCVALDEIVEQENN